MSLKLVIFDVDGLLLDTERVWQDVWYDTARDFGIDDWKREDFLNVVGRSGQPVDDYMEELFRGRCSTEEFMKGIRKLCDEEGILMICDEVQCGMGRTGAMFAWQAYDIKPDIMSMAKAIGSGIPVGAFAMTEEVAKYSLEPGDHGTTYGGNPLACTAVSKTIEIFEKKHLVEHVQKVGAYLTKKLEELVEEYDTVKAVKGKGLMQGIQVTKPISEITGAALKEGLLIIGAGSDVIRFVPPLIIELEQVDEMIRILKKAL